MDITGSLIFNDDHFASTFTIPTPNGKLVPGIPTKFTAPSTYTITQADIDAGSVTNSANATGLFKDQPVI